LGKKQKNGIIIGYVINFFYFWARKCLFTINNNRSENNMPDKETMEYDVLLDIIGEVRMRKIQEVSSASDETVREMLRSELRMITEEEKIMQGARSFPNVDLVQKSVADKIMNQYAPQLKAEYARQ
jgi:hypothetical protein